MGLIDCQEMRELEEKVFQAGVSAEALMNKAGRRLGEALRALYPEPGTAVAYLGRGNNGGDALVALQVLRVAGWHIALRCPFQPLELAPAASCGSWARWSYDRMPLNRLTIRGLSC